MTDFVTHFDSSSDIKSQMTGASKNSCVNTESFLNEQWISTHRLVCFNSQIASECFTTVQISRDVFFRIGGLGLCFVLFWLGFFFSRFKKYFDSE